MNEWLLSFSTYRILYPINRDFMPATRLWSASSLISIALLIGWKGSLPHVIGQGRGVWKSAPVVCVCASYSKASCRGNDIHPISSVIYSGESVIPNRTMKILSYPFSILLHHGKKYSSETRLLQNTSCTYAMRHFDF